MADEPKYAVNESGQQMRLTEDELALIKTAFGGNERLIKLLRKIFLPTYDPLAPLGQTIDLWLAMSDLKTMPPMQAYELIMARNMVIGHVESQLDMLRFFAEKKTETPEESALREKKNSTQ